MKSKQGDRGQEYQVKHDCVTTKPKPRNMNDLKKANL